MFPVVVNFGASRMGGSIPPFSNRIFTNIVNFVGVQFGNKNLISPIESVKAAEFDCFALLKTQSFDVLVNDDNSRL